MLYSACSVLGISYFIWLLSMFVSSRGLRILISGCIKQCRKFPCGNPLFQEQILTRDLHYTISTWGQSEKAIAACLHHIGTEKIQAPGRPAFLTLHHPPTLESPTWPTKKSCYSKNCTQCDSIPSDLLHSIGMCHAVLVQHNKIKLVLAQLTKLNTITCASRSYKLKYAPFN